MRARSASTPSSAVDASGRKDAPNDGNNGHSIISWPDDDKRRRQRTRSTAKALAKERPRNTDTFAAFHQFRFVHRVTAPPLSTDRDRPETNEKIVRKQSKVVTSKGTLIVANFRYGFVERTPSIWAMLLWGGDPGRSRMAALIPRKSRRPPDGCALTTDVSRNEADLDAQASFS